MGLRNWFNLIRRKEAKSPDADQSGAPESPPMGRMDTAPSPNNDHSSNLELNLGIDFGTSYTKVCFRNVGAEQSEIVNFGGNATEDAFIASIVTIRSDGMLFLYGEHEENECIHCKYLKMKLADFGSIEGVHEQWQGVKLDDDNVIRALSSWFLARVISKSKDWIVSNRGELLLGRDVRWSANVGVPVEHCDSERIEVFEEVFSVGWNWAESGELPNNLQTAIKRYEDEICVSMTENTDCHAMPELSAAIQSFVISREAQQDVYMYFDIGGGTVDGVSFNYFAPGGEKSVNFYSGRVRALGVSAITNSLGGAIDQVEEILMTESAPNLQTALDELGEIRELLDNKRHGVQQIVGHVITKFRRKDPLKNFENIGAIQSKKNRLMVFIGGGGMGSEWYKDAICCTHADFGHDSIKVPPYELCEVPNPSDFKMNGIPRNDYHRFAIAFGLSVPFGEGPVITLPSKIPLAEAQKTQAPTVPNYLNTKEIYD